MSALALARFDTKRDLLLLHLTAGTNVFRVFNVQYEPVIPRRRKSCALRWLLICRAEVARAWRRALLSEA